MKVFFLKKNNAKSTLSVAISDSDTTITVADGSKFPISGNFIITIWNKDTYADPGDDVNMEILKVTGVVDNVFTVTRAQEGTVAKAHSLGYAVEVLFTAGQIEELEDEVNNKRDDFTIGNGLSLASGNVLIVDGGIQVNLASKTADYVATGNDCVIICDASGGAFTVTLPAAASQSGRVYHIKKVDSSANTVTINGNGSETIDGALTAVLTTQYESISIISEGSEWLIF